VALLRPSGTRIRHDGKHHFGALSVNASIENSETEVRGAADAVRQNVWDWPGNRRAVGRLVLDAVPWATTPATSVANSSPSWTGRLPDASCVSLARSLSGLKMVWTIGKPIRLMGRHPRIGIERGRRRNRWAAQH
jgi:hypothetical protein